MYWKMVINFTSRVCYTFVVSANFHSDKCIYYEFASSMKINSCW